MDNSDHGTGCFPEPQSNCSTQVVYVCSPSYEHCLFRSLQSLLKSGSSFDGVTIYCVGERPSHWFFVDSRIEIKEVPERRESSCLKEGRFLANKTYLCADMAQRIIYLDADTLISKPIDTVWRDQDCDVIARTASYYHNAAWDHGLWSETLRRVGGNERQPYFNSGFLVFQNASHRRLLAIWPEMIERLATGELTAPSSLHPGGTKFAEQLALSLSMSAKDFSFHEMTIREHSFWWTGDCYDESIVFHTGGGNFLKAVATVAPSLDEGAPPLLRAG